MRLFNISFLSNAFRQKFRGNGTSITMTDFIRSVIGAMLSLIATHVIMYKYSNEVFSLWWGSFAFYFLLVSIIVSVFCKYKNWITSFWYYVLLIVLPIFTIYIHFKQNPIKSEASNDGQKTEVQVPDTTYHNVNGTLAMILVHGETYETTLPPNCEVVVRGTNFKQIITTDSLGIKNLKTVEGDASQIGAGQFVFIHTKGNGAPSVKVWRVF